MKPGLLHRAATVPYLFSGLLKCSECGANLTILIGRGKDGKGAAYGCPHHFNRGTCSNGLYQRRDHLEQTLLSGLQRALLDDSVIDETLAKVLKAVTLAETEQSGTIRDLKVKQSEIGRELQNLTDAICNWRLRVPPQSNTNQGSRAEFPASDLEGPGIGTSLKINHEELRSRIHAELADLPALVNLDPARAKAELQKHVSEIRMVPTVPTATASMLLKVNGICCRK